LPLIQRLLRCRILVVYWFAALGMVTQARALRTPTTSTAFCFSLSTMQFTSSVNALGAYFAKD
jgi:hypothetical protein